MPRTGERKQTRRSDNAVPFLRSHARHCIRGRVFILTGEPVSPARPMAPRAPEAKVTPMNASPMAWTARMSEPSSPYPEGEMTVLLRVTYNTLESIIRDEFMLTESRVSN